MKELLIRFLIGGAVVSVFAMRGDLFRPKSFAGLFGAAPSIALATLGLTIIADGKDYAGTEARSMVAGGLARHHFPNSLRLQEDADPGVPLRS